MNSAIIDLTDLFLLTASWSSLCPYGKAQAIETARTAAQAWARDPRNRLTREEVVGSIDFMAFLLETYGKEGLRRWGRLEDGWTEDEDDFRCCHFCAVLEEERRRMHGLSPIPTDLRELQSALAWDEAGCWEAEAAMGREWAAIKDRWEGNDTPGAKRYEATKAPFNSALGAALLARMLLNVATGTVTPSDVWECRACIDGDSDEWEEMEVHLSLPDTMADAGEDFRCEPKGAGNRAEMALAVK
jgi:hypothetical protein